MIVMLRYRSHCQCQNTLVHRFVYVTIWPELFKRWIGVDFPLSRNFSLRPRVKCACVSEVEAMYGRPRVNVKVERGSTLTFTRDLPYFAFIFFFTRVKFTCVRT